MNNFNVTDQMAQGAAIWNEREQHTAVMEKLKEISYKTEVHVNDVECAEYYIGESFTHYYVTKPSDDELLEIINRGNHEEIMYMISRFHELLDFKPTSYNAYLPVALQKALIKRNNPEEIRAITNRYGFCEEAQDTMFEHWSRDQLMAYSNRHGFAEKGQLFVLQNWPDKLASEYIRRHGVAGLALGFLIANNRHNDLMTQISTHGFSYSRLQELVTRGNHDEIMAALNGDMDGRYSNYEDWFGPLLSRNNHEEIMAGIKHLSSRDFTESHQLAIWKRGNSDEFAKLCQYSELCSAVLDEMFSGLESGWTNNLFKVFAIHTRKSLPVPYQERFIQIANSQDFATYISRQGFYKEVLKTMVQHRSIQDIRVYLSKHCFLSNEAIPLFLEKASDEDIVYYYQHAYCTHTGSFLNGLLAMRPLNYDLLSSIFLEMPDSWGNDPKEVQLMKEGTPEQLRTYFKTVPSLCRKAFLTLFFRMDKALFEDYLTDRTKYFD